MHIRYLPEFSSKHVDIVTTGGQQALLEFERLIDEETAVYRQTVSRAVRQKQIHIS